MEFFSIRLILRPYRALGFAEPLAEVGARSGKVVIVLLKLIKL
jgi:hypothetical protein